MARNSHRIWKFYGAAETWVSSEMSDVCCHYCMYLLVHFMSCLSMHSVLLKVASVTNESGMWNTFFLIKQQNM
jgi:hypothetical protein